MLPFYKPELVGHNGETLLTILDAVSVNAARQFNTDGSCTIVVPDYYPKGFFRFHTRMVLWRHDYKGVPRAFGKTVWFLKKTDHDYDAKTLTLTFVDAFAMLKGRLVGYTGDGTYADKTMEEYEAITYIEALRIANMMRAYVRENVGDEVLDETREIEAIDIEEDRPEGPFGEKQASFQELGATLNDLARMADAKGTPMYYDLLPQANGKFLFRVWSGLYGNDRGSTSENPLLITYESGFLAEVHEIEDYTNVASFCWALGEGSGGSQLLATSENIALTRSDPFGRIEMTVNASDTSNATVLADAATAALAGRLPKRTVSCKIAENSSLAFQADVDYGDQVVVQVGGTEYDCVLNAVSTTWQDGVEALDLRLQGEVPLGTRAIFVETVVPDPDPDPDPENQVPIVNAGSDDTVAFGGTAALDGTVTDDGLPDPPAALTYEWTQVSGPGTANFATPDAVDTDCTFDVAGVYVLRLTASDSLLSAHDDVTITVEEEEVENTPPVVDAGPDQTISSIMAAVIDGDVSDDNLPNPPGNVTYLWTQISGPGTAFFGPDDEEDTVVTFDTPGVYVLRLTASDSELSAYDEVTITVEE